MAKNDSNVVVAAFTEDEARRLTGISLTQLRYWHRTSFFSPSLADTKKDSLVGSLYSFRDLVSLQVLNTLRNDTQVSLQHLRDVKVALAAMGEDIWAKTTIYVLGKRIVIKNRETGEREDVLSGQGVLKIPLKVARANMEQAVKALRSRNIDFIGQIEKNRGVARNQPVIAGTGIRASSIKAFHDAGFSVAQIKAEYPVLTEKDIEAAIAHNVAA